MKRYNRIRIVLAEKDLKNRWLSDQLDVNPATVSKWCSNAIQPRIPMLYRIAEVLEVDARSLLIGNTPASLVELYPREEAE